MPLRTASRASHRCRPTASRWGVNWASGLRNLNGAYHGACSGRRSARSHLRRRVSPGHHCVGWRTIRHHPSDGRTSQIIRIGTGHVTALASTSDGASVAWLDDAGVGSASTASIQIFDPARVRARCPHNLQLGLEPTRGLARSGIRRSGDLACTVRESLSSADIVSKGLSRAGHRDVLERQRRPARNQRSVPGHRLGCCRDRQRDRWSGSHHRNRSASPHSSFGHSPSPAKAFGRRRLRKRLDHRRAGR